LRTWTKTPLETSLDVAAGTGAGAGRVVALRLSNDAVLVSVAGAGYRLAWRSRLAGSWRSKAQLFSSRGTMERSIATIASSIPMKRRPNTSVFYTKGRLLFLQLEQTGGGFLARPDNTG